MGPTVNLFYPREFIVEQSLIHIRYRFGDHSDELEFIILDMKNSNSLCYTLKIWAEDDSASSPIQPSVDDLVLLQFEAGREVNRLPARQLCNDDSSDDEDPPTHDSHSSTPVLWSQVCRAVYKLSLPRFYQVTATYGIISICRKRSSRLST